MSEAIIDNLQLPVAILDRRGAVMRANLAFWSLCAGTPEASIRRDLVDLAPPSAQAQLCMMLAQALETGVAVAELPWGASDARQRRCEIRRLSRPVSGGVATIAIDNLDAAEDNMRLHEDELNHRVRNSLHVISSFVSAERRRGGESVDGYSAIQSRINAVAALYEVMAQAGRGGAVHADIFFANLADGFRGSLLGEGGGVTIRVQAAPAVLEAHQAGPVALIVNELVTNAVKHAFPERGGEISILMEDATTGPVIIVADNGVGVPAGASAGLGTRCIAAFVRQLQGELTLHSDSQGARFTLRLPPSRRTPSTAAAEARADRGPRAEAWPDPEPNRASGDEVARHARLAQA